MLHMVLFLSLNASCMQMTDTNYKQALVADDIDEKKNKNKTYSPTVPCELGWKRCAKLASCVF